MSLLVTLLTWGIVICAFIGAVVIVIAIETAIARLALWWMGGTRGLFYGYLPREVREAVRDEAEGTVTCSSPRWHSHDWGIRIRWKKPHLFRHHDVEWVFAEVRYG